MTTITKIKTLNLVNGEVAYTTAGYARSVPHLAILGEQQTHIIVHDTAVGRVKAIRPSAYAKAPNRYKHPAELKENRGWSWAG